MRSRLLAPLRCLYLLLLSFGGLVVAEVGVLLLALVVPLPLVLWANRRLAETGRRLSLRWGGVAIAASYPSPAAEPVRREDGWYEHDRQLYRHPHVPRLLRRTAALGDDRTVKRDWLWLTLTPFAGGLAVAVPLAVTAAGVALAVLVPTAVGIGAGVVLAIAGFVVAPYGLRLYALWSRFLLQPVEDSWWGRSGFGRAFNERWLAIWRGAGLAGMGIAAFGMGLVVLVVGVLSWTGLLPTSMRLVRPFLNYYRRRSAEWTGAVLDPPYRPEPSPPRPDASGRYRVGRFLYDDLKSATAAQRIDGVLRDPASWRDLLWMLTAPVLSPLGIGLATVVAVAFFGLVLQPLWWAPWAVPIGLIQGVWVTPWYIWYGVTLLDPGLAVVPTWASPLIGLVATGIAILLARPALRLRVAWDRLLLSPTRQAVLAQRVHQLTESRSDAIDAQAAEVRRIERDLHDGAQARLVALGLSLAAAEQLLERDPAAARALLAHARETSTTALNELRDLVRGIHPPVLAERGLVDAVRAVALDNPLPVTVNTDLAGRLEAPVESAAYFAVTEALANAVRHAGASHILVDLRHDGERLRITVTDDGRGGADPSRGTGLSGIRRRLGTFDGTMTVTSPAGGPTVLTMEVPCAYSSPKTSTS
jgi:signal transduction histidine kinase